MKKLLLFLCTFLCSVGMWAVDQTKSFTWTATNTYTVTNSSFTADDVTWTFSVSDGVGVTTGQYIPTSGAKSDNQYGLKFGNGGSAYYGTVTFTSDFFNDYNVKSVTMKVKNNGSKIGTLTAKQGSTTIGTASHSAATNAWGSLTATGTTGNKGALVVTYQVAQASYVQSISVTYEVPAAPSVAYTVTFNANTNGTCSTASLTEASAGAGVTLPSCTPNANYGFVGWATTNDATSANAGKATETYYPTADVTLYAVYANLYTVTIETPTNGTLVVKNGETVVNNGDQVAEGTTLNVTATPNRGYAFRNWQAVDATTHTYTSTFTYDVASAVTIKANFDELAKHTVTLADDNTELTPEYGGEAVVLPSRTAIGAYTFAGWSETNVAEEATTTPIIIEAGQYIASADVTLYPIYTRSEAGGATDVPVSLKIADNLPDGTNSGDKVASFTLDENVTAASTGGDSNSSKIYGTPLSQWRFYRTDNGAMTITTTAGTLKSVTVTYSVDKNGVMLHGEDEIASGTAVENIDATSITFTVGGGESSTKLNGVIRITDIAVVYTVDGQTTYYLSSPVSVPTFASLDELIDANLEEETVVNVTISDVVYGAMGANESYIVMLQNSGAYLIASGSDLGWEMGGTVSGTLENVTWNPNEYTLSSETDFWSSLSYTAPAGGATETITINPACTDGDFYYTTYSSVNAFYVPEDITVYEVMVVDDEIAFEGYKTGDLVPPYTGVLICATEGGDFEVDIETDPENIALAESVLGDDNALRPTCIPEFCAEDMEMNDPGKEYFRLTMHNGTQCGFWWGAANGAAFDIAANKAYLVADPAVTPAAVRGFSFNNGEATAIKTVNTTANNAVRYNLAGQRVNANVKGIIVVNGKKALK